MGPLSFLNVTPATFISKYSNGFGSSGVSETVAGWITAVSFSSAKTGGAGVLGTGAAAGVSAVSVFTVLSCGD